MNYYTLKTSAGEYTYKGYENARAKAREMFRSSGIITYEIKKLTNEQIERNEQINERNRRSYNGTYVI